MDKNISAQTRCISHEIRNQLSVCELYTQIIRKHLEKDGVNNYSISNALDCIEKSVKLINNSLLDLKLLNNLEIKNCDLNLLLSQSINLSQVYTIGRDIDIIYEQKPDCVVKVDENKFIACVVNILKNAIESIESVGKVEVILEVEENSAVIKFKNNGKEIPIDVQNNIFNEGFTTKQTGCGLGLHICRTNLQKMSADLKLNYSNQDATEFEIILPVV